MQKEDYIEGISAAAKYLGISRPYVYKLMRKKLFPAPVDFSNGGNIKFWKRADLDSFREKLPPRGQKFYFDVVEALYVEISSLKKQNEEMLQLLLRIEGKFSSGVKSDFVGDEELDELSRVLEIKFFDISSMQSFSHPIEFPRIYEAMKKEVASLGIEKFKSLVEKLAAEKVVELHSPGGIEIDDRFLLGEKYCLMWR